MIKIAIISNFLNHHMLPLCMELIKRNDVCFSFISMEETNEEQLNLGYKDMNNMYNFVIKGYQPKEKHSIYEIIKTYDLIIYCGVWGKLVKIRHKKQMFRISERFLKEQNKPLILFLKKIKYFLLTRCDKNVRLLCCGKFVKKDFAYARYKNNYYRWGYFPEHNNKGKEIISKKTKNTFIWAGRFISWKHPEYIIKLATALKKKQLDFSINVVGTGPLFDSFVDSVNKLNLSDKINIFGPQPYKTVRKIMESCVFHLFTSDYNEGWGAVLNESMDSYCIPIANDEIGSSTFLIQNGINGFSYHRSYEDFEKVVIDAINIDDSHLFNMQINSFKTISEQWNAKIAIDRLLKIIHNPESNFNDCGPLTKF